MHSVQSTPLGGARDNNQTTPFCARMEVHAGVATSGLQNILDPVHVQMHWQLHGLLLSRVHIFLLFSAWVYPDVAVVRVFPAVVYENEDKGRNRNELLRYT